MGFTDIQAAIGQSQAAFVGTLIETHDPHGSGQLVDSGRDVTHVFEVETWVKGDLGQVIEVHSAADGASCGMEFWDDDNRIAAFLSLENGQLHSSLCAQIDPEVLVAAAKPPVFNPSLAPAIIAGTSDTTVLTMIGGNGELIGTLDPIADVIGFEATSDLSLCPGGRRLAQTAGNTLVIWALESYEIESTHQLVSPDEWVSVLDLSCRSEDANSVWLLGVVGEFGLPTVYETVPDLTPLHQLPRGFGSLGGTHAVVTDDPATMVVRVNYETGETVTLLRLPGNQIAGAYPFPNPINDLTAVVVVTYHEGRDPVTTVSLYDGEGSLQSAHPIPGEGGASAAWLDESRLALATRDYHGSDLPVLYVLDIGNGETTEVPGWEAWAFTGMGTDVYGSTGGTIQHADLSTGEVTDSTVLPYTSVNHIVTVTGLEPPGDQLVGEPVTTTPTVPPLTGDFSPVAGPSSSGESASDPQRVAQAVWWVIVAGAAGAAAYYTLRSRRPPNNDQVS
jgi:hypothetical protein